MALAIVQTSEDSRASPCVTYSRDYSNPNIAEPSSQPRGSLLIVNCRLWSGRLKPDENPVAGLQNVYIADGIIVGIGNVNPPGIPVLDAQGMPCTPGLVDMHSHVGVYSWPEDQFGNSDGNEMTSPVVPYMRARDAIDPMDPAFDLIRSGGITTSAILPGR